MLSRYSLGYVSRIGLRGLPQGFHVTVPLKQLSSEFMSQHQGMNTEQLLGVED